MLKPKNIAELLQEKIKEKEIDCVGYDIWLDLSDDSIHDFVSDNIHKPLIKKLGHLSWALTKTQMNYFGKIYYLLDK